MDTYSIYTVNSISKQLISRIDVINDCSILLNQCGSNADCSTKLLRVFQRCVVVKVRSHLPVALQNFAHFSWYLCI